MPYHTIQMKPCTPPAKKPRLFRVAYLSLIWFAATICALLFTAYPANASLMLNTSGDQNYTLDMAIPNLQLPAATGGTGTLDYTLTGPGGGALPEGLIFTPGTRTLSGTPSTIGSTILTYTVTDTSDAEAVITTSTTFTVMVNTLNTPGDQRYTTNTAIPDLQLPEATGGTGTLTYTLTGPISFQTPGGLPRGLSFNANTRTLSGTPKTPGTFALTYTVTDAAGTVVSTLFTVTVTNSLRFHRLSSSRSPAPGDQNYAQGTAIPNLQLPVATGGTGTRVYTLTGPDGLPMGLSFNANTRTLSGTPSALGSTLLTYTATDAAGTVVSRLFTVTVKNGLTLNTPGDQGYKLNTAIADLQLPAATGGTGTRVYTLTGVPGGLNFTAGTRRLSGTPSTVGSFALTYTVTDANTSESMTFEIRISSDLRINTSGNQNYTQGIAIPDLTLPEATGGFGTRVYTLTGIGDSDLPAGLTFDPDTRMLSGTPSTVGSTNLLYLVGDDSRGGGPGFVFTITVSSNLRLNTSGNRGYTQNTLITNLQLPEATGGFGMLVYTLTGPDGLPMGLEFDPGTRTLSGTPSTVGVTTLTYTVTDINDAFTAMFSKRFTVTVKAGLTLNASGDQNYTLDTAITGLTLPEATGGTGTLQYTLTAPGGGLPAGLTFNASTRTLSGTPSTPGTTILTYMATDTSDVGTVTFSTTFTVKVNASLALSASGDQNYTQGTAISVQLPAATGGTAPLTYTLTGLPAGLTFDTRILSGTPDTPGTFDLTYKVTDDNGASKNATFTVSVSDGLALSAQGNQNYTQDKAIPDLQLPVATGGTEPLTYTLTSVPGLDFDADTRILSGTPDTADTFDLTYTVTDANGATTSVDFMVIVSDGLALSARGNQNYTQGTAITNLELPVATGGTGTLVYTLTGPGDSTLPGGLEFDVDTRILSGTPDTADTTVLTYTVTDANDASTTATFTVIVSDGLALSARGNQNYTQDKAIPDLELPVATGGTGTRTYTLTGPGDSALPGGLEFDVDTRILSGTPDTADTTVLTYTVTDANDASTTATFTVIVSDGLAPLTASGDQNYTQGRAITALTLPVATGGTAPLTYTLTSVPGLSFNADTRTLSGTPSTADTTTLTYEVTDANGASTSVDFMVIVSDSLTLNARGDQNYTQGTAITNLQLPVATGGTGTLVYTLTGPSGGNLPGGLNFTAGTRTLSGTPSTPATTTLTYRVTDDNGATTFTTFTVIVSDGLALTASGDQNYTQGTAITNLQLPEATGGTMPLTYTLTSVPGLDFNAGTRTLSGTPSTADTTTLTYEVTDANNASTSVDFTVTVNAGLTLTASGNQNYTLNTAITDLQLPVATGGTMPLTYTLTGPGDSALPGGLNFTAGTRTLSGTPSTAGTTTLTYRVTDTNGASTTATFTVIVNAELALDTPDDQNYTQGTAISVQLPEASDGTAPLTYTLIGPGDSALPGGLTFTPGTRTLSGTPSTAATTTLTYRVTDTNGASKSVNFTVIVSDSLTLTASGDQNYTQGTAINNLQLPVATGGTGTLTYTLTNVPAGLTFTPGTRTLSGTPDTDGDFTLTYEVMDDNGASTSVDFTVTVNEGLALTAPANQNYTEGRVITALELPVATGGTGTLTYTLTSVPGLTFTPGTRILSGTPSTADTTTLTYTVTDTNGASENATFMVTVNASLALTASGNQNYTEGRVITALELPVATGGTGTLVYTLTGPGDSALPGGLEFDADTRILSGTPDTADTTVLTYTVTDDNGADESVTFTVSVSDSLTLNARGDQNYTEGRVITALELPEATGGTGTLTYTLTGPGDSALPGGLNFTAGTRTLSGTPSTADTTTLTYTVTDTNGASTTATFTVIVSDGLALTASGNQNYTEGRVITALELPVATGGTGTLVYTLTGPGDSALPGGLTFSGRTLSGTPDTADTTILTYTVTDTNNANTSVDFTVIVSDSLGLDTPANQNYTEGRVITALELPEATGGTGTLTYTLTSVPGLTFTPGTRILSGTPSTADTTTLTYTVTDTNGASENATFMVTVNASLALTASGNQNYTEGRVISDLELPVATGGTGAPLYTLTGL